jgi:hypothetical protein
MPAQPTPSANIAPTDASAADAWRPVLERQVEMLGQMAEAGFEMVMALRRQALATLEDEPSNTEPAVDLKAANLAFSKASRAVRMTLALQAKVIEDIRAPDRGDPPETARPSPAEARRKRVRTVVERAIVAEHGAGREFEQMSKFAERLLDDEDLCDDVLSRPMSELVAMICKDLGLKPDWVNLSQETWARREIDTGPVGAPLKNPKGFTAAADAPKRMIVMWANTAEDVARLEREAEAADAASP